MKIAHLAPIEIERKTGMGRVAHAWREAFERHGHQFTHLDVARTGHPAMFAARARRVARHAISASPPDIFLAHEPSAFALLNLGRPVIAFSHGLERRGWEASLRFRHLSGEKIRLRSRLLFPVWRLWPCEIGLRRAARILVLNGEDLATCIARYRRRPQDVFLFRNGVDPRPLHHTPGSESRPPTVLSIGNWIPRKGTRTMVEAAVRLHADGVAVRWLIAGTGCPADQVRDSFPPSLRSSLDVRPSFSPEQEPGLHAEADLFVLASFFEGQPLALLQAMAAGLCCVATDCCGQRDVIKSGENGMLFERGDAAALAGEIARLLPLRSERQRLGTAAATSMVGRSWNLVADEVVRYCTDSAGTSVRSTTQ